MHLDNTPGNQTDPLDHSSPYHEVTLTLPWPGGWMANAVGVAFTPGFSGAFLRLAHWQTYDPEGNRLAVPVRPELEDPVTGAGLLIPGLQRMWWSVPLAPQDVPNTVGALTIQGAWPSGLDIIIEIR